MNPDDVRVERHAAPTSRPNILYVHIDNLGMGELGCYGGGILRGAATARLDHFASEGLQLLNFAPEAQCTPSRSALMTGRYAIRSGNGSVQLPGLPGGLVAWEQTMGDILSRAGYATAVYGKWHIGDEPGRYPTDHGFDEWYGIPHSYDECLWPDDPLYNPDRDAMSYVVAGTKGGSVENLEQLTMEVRRNIDREYLSRAEAFIRRSVASGTPFYVYFNHSMLHLPTVPRDEFKGQSGAGDFADCLLEMDADFGTLVDLLDELNIADNTDCRLRGRQRGRGCAAVARDLRLLGRVIFHGNGRVVADAVPDSMARTRCSRTGQQRNRPHHRYVHNAHHLGGCQVPGDRVIDGVDQGAFFRGDQDQSNRQGFLFWNGNQLYGAKWQNFKTAFVEQRNFFDASPPVANPRIINLLADPKEREPVDYPYLHTWVVAHFVRLFVEFRASIQREPLIPFGAPLDFVPGTTEPAQSPSETVLRPPAGWD